GGESQVVYRSTVAEGADLPEARLIAAPSGIRRACRGLRPRARPEPSGTTRGSAEEVRSQRPMARQIRGGSARMGLRVAQFLAVVLLALALIPGGAHLFELPGKIDLGQEAYFTVQSIYRGWSLFGFVLFGALFANLALAIALARQQRRAFGFALAALILVAANLAIFFLWTYPANQATSNWTVAPADWDAHRIRWELSHAANALVMFAAFCCAVLSVLTTRE